MTYKNGSWGKEAQKRSQGRKEYFREYQSKNKKEFFPKGCIKRNARQKVRDHILSGKIIKPKDCSSCSIVNKLEAHHSDYSKPLEIVWLCRSCHVTIHKK